MGAVKAHVVLAVRRGGKKHRSKLARRLKALVGENHVGEVRMSHGLLCRDSLVGVVPQHLLHTHTHTPESCEKWKGSLTPPPHAQDWRGTQTNLDQVVAVFVKPWHQRLQRDGGVSREILLVWPREHSGVRLCDKALRCHSNDCSVFHAVATRRS